MHSAGQRLISSLLLATIWSAAAVVAAEVPEGGFESEAWTITNGRVVDHLGRRALAGSAFLMEEEFGDGVIEVDVAMDGRRCFPGVVFRAQSEGDTEIFYLRPHRSINYSHALQYTPGFGGVTGWQLYSGPGYTAGADIPLDRWVPLRIEVVGRRARIFLDDMETPALVVGDLERGDAPGFVGVTAPPDGRVHFSNFRVSSAEGLDFGPRPIRAAAGRNLAEWEISQPIAPPQINRDLDPGAQDLGEIEWRSVTADDTGLIDISRFLESPPRLPKCVIARTVVSSEREQRSKLAFGYSDEISIFFNGDLLFRGDSSFRVRDTEFMGIIGLNDAVVLDLDKGDNDLVFVVTESFGGWGFMARTDPLRSDPIQLSEGVSALWRVDEGLMMPESAVWDPGRELFYVSNMSPEGPGGFGETGYIVRIDPVGRILEEKWITGLSGPTGVAVLGDHLYVVERPGVAVIDIEAGTIARRISVATEGGFINDLAVAGDGTIFVSDSARGEIHRIEDGKAALWLTHESLAGANGLLVEGDRLWITTMGSESLVAIDLETRKIETVVDLRPFGGDGITTDGGGGFLLSDYTGLLLQVQATGSRTVLIDSRDTGISLTDFAFAPEPGMVLIPTLRGNSLMAFSLGGSTITAEGQPKSPPKGQ